MRMFFSANGGKPPNSKEGQKMSYAKYRNLAEKRANDTPERLAKSALKWDPASGRMPRGVGLRKYVSRMIQMAQMMGNSEIGFQDPRTETRLNPPAIVFFQLYVAALRETIRPDICPQDGDAQEQLWLFRPDELAGTTQAQSLR